MFRKDWVPLDLGDLSIDCPVVDFDNIVVQPAMSEQIAALCKKSPTVLFGGFEVHTSESIPQNGYVLRQGGKVIAVGIFGEKK